MMMLGNGQLSVPPGFRFHPTDEELLYYYLRKKVSYEAIDLDVIREVDLNKLEPWDLKGQNINYCSLQLLLLINVLDLSICNGISKDRQEKCRIGSSPQNEWYFFSHKDKKYPTGTRTNRATAAGFWKATGRDKAIHLSSKSNSRIPKRIGMRKTLVFYTGRAPHGQKTDWIMHEYRLDNYHENNTSQLLHQEDGWVVCRVFEKKSTSHNRGIGYLPEYAPQDDQEEHYFGAEGHKINASTSTTGPSTLILEPKQNLQQALYDSNFGGYSSSSMHLPHLLSPDHHQSTSFVNRDGSFLSPTAISSFNMDMECSQNLLSLTSLGGDSTNGREILQQQYKQERTTFNGTDWSFLDKLLASHQNQNQNQLEDLNKCHVSSQALDVGAASQIYGFPFDYIGCETDILKFSKLAG
ncbi:hypothetical protein Vadar_013230 [Vaccinium darrowii]|uniref:Uncharacterized protein n=1 Tax=Vaccinium darrowii TaxID=229202 RepID=A0ACB7Y0D6_9ERIC|nr:hypothetical protein Vadar_013230 [Vaccinium darrowii]